MSNVSVDNDRFDLLIDDANKLANFNIHDMLKNFCIHPTQGTQASSSN